MRSAAQGERMENVKSELPSKALTHQGKVSPVSDNGQRRIMNNRGLFASIQLFPERFRKKVQLDKATGCWLWTGSANHPPGFPKYKYGVYAIDGRDPLSTTYAHRFAYEFIHGRILPGLRLDIDHICKTKLCVNPAHLRAITHQDNCKLRRQRGRVTGSQRWWQERRKKGL